MPEILMLTSPSRDHQGSIAFPLRPLGVVMSDFKLRGIFPPLITPFTSSGELDADGLKRLLDYVTEAGVHGVFLLGTCGEGPSMGHLMREKVLAVAADHIDNALQLVVNASSNSMEDALEIAQFAAGAGAAAVAMAAPVYYPIGQAELIAFLMHFAANTKLPVLAYNAPKAKIPMELATIEILSDAKNIFGIKDGSGDGDLLRQILKKMEGEHGWTVLTGPERYYADHLRHGGHGGICAGSNFRPDLFVKGWNAAQQEDTEQLEAIEAEILNLAPSYGSPRTTTSTIYGLKKELENRGICGTTTILPLTG